MGNHIVLFIFDNKLEVDTILANEPWSFDKHLMVLQRYDEDMLVEELQFWVQVHDIPVRFMNQKMAEGICSNVGMVFKKFETEGEGGSFMRVRVRLDITIPLSRGRMVSLGQGKEHGYRLNTSTYQISAIGVAVSTMTIGTVKLG